MYLFKQKQRSKKSEIRNSSGWPNFICRAIDYIGIELIDYFCKNFSLYSMAEEIKDSMEESFMPQTLQDRGIEFIYSQKRPGKKKEKLTEEQWKSLIERFSNPTSTYLNKVDIISKNSEKGVDIAVAIRMVELAEFCDIICLVSSDKDYIPVLEYLRRKGKLVVTIGAKQNYPLELKNLSYLYIANDRFYKLF